MTACSGSGPDGDTDLEGPGISFSLTDSPPHLLIATRDDITSGFDAEVIGLLRYLPEDACFVLDNLGDGTYSMALAWPPGTMATARGDGAVVTVPGFGDVRPGDWLLGGGYYENPDRGLPEMSAACSPSATEFAVLYDVDEAGPEPLIEE